MATTVTLPDGVSCYGEVNDLNKTTCTGGRDLHLSANCGNLESRGRFKISLAHLRFIIKIYKFARNDSFVSCNSLLGGTNSLNLVTD